MKSNRPTTAGRSTAAKKRPRWYLLILYTGLIGLGLALLIFGRGAPVQNSENARQRSTTPEQATQIEDAKRRQPLPSNSVPAAGDDNLVDDDGQTLWRSPTDGSPHDLAYLPPGVQVAAVLRPQAILAHSEGQKLLGALGPGGESAMRAVEEITQTQVGRMQRLTVGWQTTSDGTMMTSFVVHADGQVIAETIAGLKEAAEKKSGDQSYLLHGKYSYYVPRKSQGRVLVIAPAEAIEDIVELDGETPPLRRDVERMLAHTDADRHVTIVVTPNSLFSEGRGMFGGKLSGLRAPLFWFLGDEFSAVALSLHWDDNFFYELIAISTLDITSGRAAHILKERLGGVPAKLEQHVAGLQLRDYGQEIVLRLPAMVEKLVSYSRSGFDRDHAVLRGYLPAVAGHNLLMGVELALAERVGGAGMVAEATSPKEGVGGGGRRANERLRKVTSLRFVRDTLEAALEQLSQDVGVAIVIEGADLQADGITKNQSFGIDVEEKPAGEILVEILRLANPDKTATGPSDVKQKLVYVIRSSDAGAEQIVVTTRSAAATRGEELPPAFR